jgi:hypothetical protein
MRNFAEQNPSRALNKNVFPSSRQKDKLLNKNMEQEGIV